MFSCCLDKNRGYIIKHQVGQGAYGTAFRAVKDGKEVVLKRINMVATERFVNRVRILREVQTLNFLARSNLFSRLLDGWIDDNRITLVLESFDCDLQCVITRIESHQHVRWIARQLFSSLAFMHSAGIIHRDVKPLNIMYD
jgi:serine/threonine protein kinase